MKLNPLLRKLQRDQGVQAMNRVINRIEKDPYAKSDIQKKVNIAERKWIALDLLLDYVITWSDREDWLDKDLCYVYDYVLTNKRSREIFVMYLVDWNSIEYCNRQRLFKSWEYDILIDRLSITDRPLSIMVVCCRVYVNAVLQWRKEFVADDFNSVIQWCKWKKLDVY